MKFGTILGFKDVFPGMLEPPVMEELMAKLCSKMFAEYLCSVTGNLHYSPNNPEVHGAMIQALISRQPNSIQQIINERRNELSAVQQQSVLFDEHVIMEVINSVLQTYNQLPYDVPTVRDEQRILGSILLANTKFNVNPPQPRDTDPLTIFCKLSWPYFFLKAEFIIKREYVSHAYFTMKLFKYIESNERFRTAMLEWPWLQQHKNINIYWYKLQEFYINGANLSNGSRFSKFTLDLINSNPLLEGLILDFRQGKPEDFEPVDYLSIRQKPILRISDQEFLVPNWDFLLSKSYIGLLMDLFRNTSLKTQYNNRFDTFKSEIGEEFSEKFAEDLLRTTIVLPDFVFLRGEPSANNNQDFYLRKSNQICLIEFKDIMPKKLYDYDSIVAHLDSRLVNQKGVSQLAKLMEKLNNDINTFEPGLHEKYGTNQLILQPIILVSDSSLTIPGVSEYLDKKLKELMIPTSFYVRELIVIDINYFLEFHDTFKIQRVDFFKIMNLYHKKKFLARKNSWKKGKNIYAAINNHTSRFGNFRDFQLVKKIKRTRKSIKHPESIFQLVTNGMKEFL